MKPVFFRSPRALGTWLAKHHDTATELWIGFYKKGSGKGGLTYAEALDEALSTGWIDGVRKTIDEASYTIRFSPRKARSIWSAVNIARVGELTAHGRMQPSGVHAFAGRDEERSRVYAYEQRAAALDPAQERAFQANEKAWAFFQSQAPWYRRTATWWVVSAKREETRAKRLATLIERSAGGLRLAQLTYEARGGK